MKNIILLTVCLMFIMTGRALAVPDIQTKVLFSNQTTTANSVVTDTGTRTKKTVMVNGNYSASVYGNYSGTVAFQCGPTAAGPWTTCKDRANTAASATTNTYFVLDDLARFIRAAYTQGKHGVTVWLFYAE